jgi:pimeloyl-ACP methyl ester carboxylesterase
MTPSARRRAFAAALIALVTLVALPAAAGAKVRIGPAGDAFYHPASSLLKGTHGSLIWARKAGRATTLKNGAASWTVLYRSVSPQGKPIAVSGLVTLPKGKGPKGGWKVISWSHGTTGVADVCAPSLDTTNGPAHAYIAYVDPQLNDMLAQGYAVVRSDFEGLGTGGPHPYLVGVSEGRGSVDIVRAARQLDKSVGTTWVSAGHSQGGQAALFAASLGPKWAPELKLRGVAAFAPASHISAEADAVGGLTTPGGGLSAIATLVAIGGGSQIAGLDEQALFTPAAQKLYPQIDATCLGQLGAANSFGGLAPAGLFAPGAVAKLQTTLDQMNPAVKISVPVLMLQGLADATVFPAFTNDLDTQLKGLGDSVDYKTYPGVTHGEIVAKANAAAAAFYKQRLG